MPPAPRTSLASIHDEEAPIPRLLRKTDREAWTGAPGWLFVLTMPRDEDPFPASVGKYRAGGRPHTANPQIWQPVCPRRQFGFAVSPFPFPHFLFPVHAALGPDFRPRAFAGRAALPALPLVSTLRFKSAIKSMTSPLAGRSSPSSEGSVITSVWPA